jgi:hypothetical protein
MSAQLLVLSTLLGLSMVHLLALTVAVNRQARRQHGLELWLQLRQPPSSQLPARS